MYNWAGLPQAPPFGEGEDGMRRTTLLLTAVVLTSLLLASGVAIAVTREGTPRDDTIRGTNGADQIDGKAGDDYIDGRRGTDTLAGSAGDDIVLGGKGTDTLAGGAGDDFLSDGPFREFQRDVLDGGDGNDEVSAFNSPASRDIVGCGDGFDRAEVDRKDIVGDDCERVLLFF